MTGRGLILFLFSFMLCVPEVYAQKTNPIKDDLNKLGKDLKKSQKLYRRLLRQSTSLLGEMGKLDAELEEANKQLQETQARMDELEMELEKSRIQQRQASVSLDLLKKRLKKRLRILYMQGDVGWLNLIFSSESISEGLQRYDLIEHLAKADQQLYENVVISRDRLWETQKKIRQQRKSLEQTRQQLKKKKEAAEAAREEKLSALDLLHKKAVLHHRALKELRHARKSLLELVATMEGKPSSAKGFATWKGRLPSPVDSPVLEVAFGKQIDPRFKTVTIHTGIDLRAPMHSPVKAVYPGKVVFAKVFQGYGRLVILDHGGGYYTLYAHLDQLDVRKGQRIQQGQQVGTVGDSGSLKGAYLYFEVRKGGKAVDPLAWVRMKPS